MIASGVPPTESPGLVLTGVGIKFGLDARSISNDLGGHEGAWTDELPPDAAAFTITGTF